MEWPATMSFAKVPRSSGLDTIPATEFASSHVPRDDPLIQLKHVQHGSTWVATECLGLFSKVHLLPTQLQRAKYASMHYSSLVWPDLHLHRGRGMRTWPQSSLSPHTVECVSHMIPEVREENSKFQLE